MRTRKFISPSLNIFFLSKVSVALFGWNIDSFLQQYRKQPYSNSYYHEFKIMCFI